QMNISDTEILLAIMNGAGYEQTNKIEESDVVLLNTCAIRENAENKIWTRLRQLRGMKKRGQDMMQNDSKGSNRRYKSSDKYAVPVSPSIKIGVLGCMAERLKTKLLEEEN